MEEVRRRKFAKTANMLKLKMRSQTLLCRICGLHVHVLLQPTAAGTMQKLAEN